MIRILHSVSNMDRAGIETMLMNYYRHMDHSKIQFDFLCNKQKPGAYDDEIAAMGGRIYRTPGLNPLKFFRYLKFMKNLFQENPDYQIVEAHNGALGVYALYAAKRNRIPVRIFHAHGASITKDWKLPLKLLCKELLPLSMNQHFTCGIDAGNCYFGRTVMEENDYILIPNAIDIEKFLFDDVTRKEIREKNGLEGKHVIGHVGRFCAQKNQAFLLDVFAELKRMDPLVHLVFIGEGDQKAEIQKRVRKIGFQDSVSFLGNIENVNQWYQAFDVFVLPSVWEGLPVVGVEAQAADLPCVFSSTITREVGILRKTQFLGLEEGCKKWAEVILDAFSKRDRENVSAMIAAHGYDISVEAAKLQERYLKLAGVQE